MRLWSKRSASHPGMPAVPFHTDRFSEHRYKQFPLFCQCPGYLLLWNCHWNCSTEILCPWATQPPEAPPHTSLWPTSNGPFPVSTRVHEALLFLFPPHQRTAFHSPLSKIYPSSTWTPGLFPHGTSSQSPFERNNSGERGRSSLTRLCYCCSPEVTLAAWRGTFPHRNKYTG